MTVRNRQPSTLPDFASGLLQGKDRRVTIDEEWRLAGSETLLHLEQDVPRAPSVRVGNQVALLGDYYTVVDVYMEQVVGSKTAYVRTLVLRPEDADGVCTDSLVAPSSKAAYLSQIDKWEAREAAARARGDELAVKWEAECEYHKDTRVKLNAAEADCKATKEKLTAALARIAELDRMLYNTTHAVRERRIRFRLPIRDHGERDA